MDINAAFPSAFLKAADLNGAPRKVAIESVAIEEVGQQGDTKPVVRFKGLKQGAVLNKTNANMLMHLFGKETDAWAGKFVELYSEAVSFQGKIVDAIRMRAPAAAPAEDFDDELPDWS